MTASPHGDSVESSGRPGNTGCEPNSADNLLLFDGENELVEGERNSAHPARRKGVVPSAHSSHGTQNVKESEDSAIFRPYARRNRSRINRDGARSSTNDVVLTRSGHGSLTARGGLKDSKGSISDSSNQKEQKIVSASNLKLATSNGDMTPKPVTCDSQLNVELDSGQTLEGTASLKGRLSEEKLDSVSTKKLTGDHDQSLQVDTRETLLDVASAEPDLVDGKEVRVTAAVESLHCADTEKTENESCSGQQNGFGDGDKDTKPIPNEGQHSIAGTCTKGLDSESSCTQNCLGLDVINDSDPCINLKNKDANGVSLERTSELEGTANFAGAELVKEKQENKDLESCPDKNKEPNSLPSNYNGNGSIFKVDEDKNRCRSGLEIEIKGSNSEGFIKNDPSTLENDKDLGNGSGDNSNLNKENSCSGRSQGTLAVSIHEIPPTSLPDRNSADASNVPTESSNQLKLMNKAHEDSILEEARIIEVVFYVLVEFSSV